MGDVSSGEGRTVLFVSHNMTAVSQLCRAGIYLKNGHLVKKGGIKEITDLYLKDSEKGTSVYKLVEEKESDLYFTDIIISNSSYEPKSTFDYHNEIIISCKIRNQKRIKNSSIFLTIQDGNQNRIFSAETQIVADKNEYHLVIEPEFLSAGTYSVTAFIHIPQLMRYDDLPSICHFDVIDTGSDFVIHGGYHHGVVFGKFEWR